MERAQSLSQDLTKITNQAFEKMLQNTSDINRTDVYGTTLLHVAAMYGFSDKVSQLAQRNDIDLNGINDSHLSALMLAIMFSHAEVVNELLKYPMNKAATMHELESALFFASAHSSVEIVEAVLKKFGIPNIYLDALNPLSGAVINNKYDVIHRLLREPAIKKSSILPYALYKKSDSKTIDILLASPDIGLNSTHMSFGALHLAAERGDIALTKALLATGKQVTPMNDETLWRWMPFEQIIAPTYHANTIYLSHTGEYKVFNIHGEVRTGTVDTSTFDLSGLRPYNFGLLSSLENDPEKALPGHIYLSQEGTYIVRNHNGTLHSGIIPNDFISILNLEELDIEIVKPNFQSRILFALTQAGHTEINSVFENPDIQRRLLSALVHAGSIISFIDVNLEGPQRDKAINLAAQNGHLNIVRELLQHPDIDVNYQRGLSKPILLNQIVRLKTPESIKTLELLLDHSRIDVNLADSASKSPLCTAVQCGNFDAVEALLKHKAIDVNQGNPLEIAIREGHYDILKLLIKHPQINVNQRTSNGLLPVCYAMEYADQNSFRYDKYVQALLSHENVFTQLDTQSNDLNGYWKNYYQAQPLIQCIHQIIESLVIYHNGYTKLVILDKPPTEAELDKNTVALINKDNEWIVYRRIENNVVHFVIDKNALDADKVKSIDIRLHNKIYNDHELIDYMLLLSSYTYIDVIDGLQFELSDFISDLQHCEFDKDGISFAIENIFNRVIGMCNSAQNSKTPLFFNEKSGPNFNPLCNNAKQECIKRIEQFECSIQLPQAA
ncbi:ankyrin repeat domain-containing protein [Legionella sp. WA2024007413]